MLCLDFLVVLGSSWGRFGTHLGSQNRPLDPADHLSGATGFRFCDRMVPRWLQDRPKRAPGGVLGPSWGNLGPLLGALGPFGQSWAVVLDRLGAFWPSRIAKSD